ncbi:MAG: bifunctional folylpolyglutamate synthase/dihydrofolate synthase [Alphaproteobacteria bacterium]|nr:bifunctional folylpolyglutamate synthase/dihydrofolate synthase [Alphaproteobacteria bacterium]
MAGQTEAILERLTRFHPKSIDLSLGRIERLLKKLGRPDQKLAPVIHVAGTNGKGSVVTYIAAVLRAAGYRVQVYTSPHLVNFAERIRLTGGIIGNDHLNDCLTACEKANGDNPITFFEITTAAAFLAFAGEPADFVVLEVGLGGRLDATNVIPRPLLTAITPVSLDHQSFLGHTLGKIAFEKGGILKRGVPAVLGRQPARSLRVLLKHAGTIGAPVTRYRPSRASINDGSWSAWETPAGITVRIGGERIELPRPALLGRHQIDNAGQSVACLKLLQGVALSDAAIAKGLISAVWPARLQALGTSRVTGLLPPRAEVWYDGGHNPSAARALAATIAGWERNDATRRPLHAVVGLLTTKDARGFLAPLARHTASITAIPIQGAAAATPAERIAALARACGTRSLTAPTLQAALAGIGREMHSSPRILITGSLYHAPEVFKLFKVPTE